MDDAPVNKDPESLQALLESGEAWGAFVDRSEFMNDDPAFGYGSRAVWFTSIDDRVDGRFRPVYETEQDLAQLRAAARNLVNLTGVRTGALDSLANYTLGKGFTFTAEPKKIQKRYREAIKLARGVQDVIDRFHDDNEFCGVMDREIHNRSREDGEATVIFDEQEIDNGRLSLEFVEPDQITEPRDPYSLEEWIADQYPECSTGNPECWKFGIHTKARRTSRILGYHIVWDGRGADFDYCPASRAEHFKRNVTRNAKRGVTDFLEPLRDLIGEAKLCRNMTSGAALQAAIAWILQGAQGATRDGMSTVGPPDKISYQRPSSFPGGAPSTANASRYGAGSILRVPDGQQYLPGPMGAERNAGFEVVGQYALRRIGIRWCMPEYMISGDASNSNYSSTLVAESPFVKAREADQQFYETHFLSLIWKAVRICVEKGRFVHLGIQENEFDKLKKLVDITCDCPKVASRDLLQAAQADKILVEIGAKSPRTVSSENGLDYDQEVQDGAKKAALEPSPFGAPGQVGPDGQPVPPKRIAGPVAKGPQEEPIRDAEVSPVDPTRRAAVEAALESVGTTAEAKAVLNQLTEAYP